MALSEGEVDHADDDDYDAVHLVCEGEGEGGDEEAKPEEDKGEQGLAKLEGILNSVSRGILLGTIAMVMRMVSVIWSAMSSSCDGEFNRMKTGDKNFGIKSALT